MPISCQSLLLRLPLCQHCSTWTPPGIRAPGSCAVECVAWSCGSCRLAYGHCINGLGYRLTAVRVCLWWFAAGLWASAGQPITVTISPAIAAQLSATGGVLGVQIGSHTDSITGKANWCRLPYNMVHRWWFKSGDEGNVVTAASGMGGLVYIVVQWVSERQCD